MMCQPINKFSFFNELVAEVKDLIKTVPFRDHVLQLGIQVKDPSDTSTEAWYESTGRIRKPDGNLVIEPHYKYTNPALKGGYIDKWLQSFTEHRVVRTRLMYMHPRTCYSIHSDPYPRIHIPIVSNRQCLMLFPGTSEMIHMPADGTSYYVDTTKLHTFINCSEVDRIHLVGVALPLSPTP